ncbi:prolyl oligopeptidase family serine peptidase [Rivibacter subsaxonicus]|uniref:Prolyl oligopeptidase n=1 Tax=Rivibacter subsaxonicus TaxID=457575 RepID=A0A4Q7W073_9BURK|nr:prolyl oligopeptidase family serine peptidase [Rivibacter subsaxonicus]RZU02594.1 prolyl oligopeptidase [Rivibacter subsaxonicus]
MKSRQLIAATALALAGSLPAHAAAPAATDDPHLWLEEVQDARALQWVRERNAVTEKRIGAEPGFAKLQQDLLEVLDSRSRIPAIQRIGDEVYNLWQDDKNRRGLWRRTTLAEFSKSEPIWETVLDLDALGAKEGVNWTWGGVSCLAPEYKRCLVRLSRGGADAVEVREFALRDKRFVEGGFRLPEAKSFASWIDADHIFVGTDFGAGSMTSSGYPRVIKRWQRGTPLAAAKPVFEGKATDTWTGVDVDIRPGRTTVAFQRAPGFFSSEWFVERSGKLVRLDKQEDANVQIDGDRFFLKLRSDWQLGKRQYKAGSLLVANIDDWLAGKRQPLVLFEPTPARSLVGFVATGSSVLLNLLDDVKTRVERVRVHDGKLLREAVALPGAAGSAGLVALHDPALGASEPLAERYLLSYTDFTTPTSLWLGDTAGNAEPFKLKQVESFFDAAGVTVEQAFVGSKDGTRIPYFIVRPKGGNSGPQPTLLYGYGGFEIPMLPAYSGAIGRAWLQRGGTYVLANLRGGGEYGPRWHQSAILGAKQRSYDDFAAIAEDLVKRGVTTPKQLGIRGGSNGGLLTGATFVQRPELFGAVISAVPLLDMRRYHKLLAGASWMAEYGNPDQPAEWSFISQYSPYQNVKPGQKYPAVLFTTSTRDDRVHPGHARKMMARMLEQGYAEGEQVFYYENIEGGHGGAADNAQRAHLLALEYGFLWQQLAGGNKAAHAQR